ncbi:hypothetical protein PGB90_007253 [Kerria lacca]
MSDLTCDMKEDVKENLAVSNINDYPKNIQELTDYIQLLLTQIQEKFQNMSDQILMRNI